jgi:glutaconate CoA-transferase subunit B
MADYNKMELMIAAASRCLEDEKLVAVGTGAPCAASMLAQKLHAPNLMVMFEAGGFAPQLPTMPISVGDSRTYFRGLMASSMRDIMTITARGLVDYCFLGGAQIDPYGNLNSTLIGTWEKPKVRMPGANDLATHAWRILCIAPQQKRRFVEKLDFLTTPGYLSGPGAREAAGLPPGTGPYKVITDMAVMGFDPETCRMRIESLHPGQTVESVKAECGFELGVAPDLAHTPPPSADELRILREQVDPLGLIIGR